MIESKYLGYCSVARIGRPRRQLASTRMCINVDFISFLMIQWFLILQFYQLMEKVSLTAPTQTSTVCDNLFKMLDHRSKLLLHTEIQTKVILYPSLIFIECAGTLNSKPKRQDDGMPNAQSPGLTRNRSSVSTKITLV